MEVSCRSSMAVHLAPKGMRTAPESGCSLSSTDADSTKLEISAPVEMGTSSPPLPDAPPDARSRSAHDLRRTSAATNACSEDARMGRAPATASQPTRGRVAPIPLWPDPDALVTWGHVNTEALWWHTAGHPDQWPVKRATASSRRADRNRAAARPLHRARRRSARRRRASTLRAIRAGIGRMALA